MCGIESWYHRNECATMVSLYKCAHVHSILFLKNYAHLASETEQTARIHHYAETIIDGIRLSP